MKRLLLILFLGLGCTFITLAQQTNRDTSNTATRNYEQMLTAELRMDFRNYALTQLNMTPAEIESFDPIYREYMNEKDRIVQRKFAVLQKFSDKMKDENSQEDRSEELGDAIEDYWEAEIAETQLQKNYFDRLEDKIDPFKAFQFFMMEDAAHTRLHELRVVEVVPMIREIERIPARNFGSNIQGDTMNMNNQDQNTTRTYDMNRDTTGNMNRNNINQNTTRPTDMTRDTTGNMNRTNLNDYNTRDTTTTTTTTPRTNTTTDDRMNNTENTTNRGATTTSARYTTITDYGNWYTSEGTSIGSADADLSHQDIYNGITKLMSAIESISTATDITITDMRSKRIRIMSLLNDLQRNRLTDRHSDEARQILTTLATMISTLQNRTNAGEESAREAMKVAVGIDTNQLLIRQLDKVNNFFRYAQTAVNEMAQGVQWSDNNRD